MKSKVEELEEAGQSLRAETPTQAEIISKVEPLSDKEDGFQFEAAQTGDKNLREKTSTEKVSEESKAASAIGPTTDNQASSPIKWLSEPDRASIEYARFASYLSENDYSTIVDLEAESF